MSLNSLEMASNGLLSVGGNPGGGDGIVLELLAEPDIVVEADIDISVDVELVVTLESDVDIEVEVS